MPLSPTAVVPAVTTALVLAAGKGTRIRSVAGDCPKPLIQVGGRTALERNLLLLADAGIRDIWINLHDRGEQIVDAIGDGSRLGVSVRYSWEPTLLGTAGAAKKLEAELGGGSFMVVYGDNVVDLDITAMVGSHHRRRPLATIAVFDRDRIPNTGLAGGRVVLNFEDRVLRFDEGVDSSSPYVNAAVYVLEPTVLDVIPVGTFTDFGRDVFPSLLTRDAGLRAYAIDGYCLGIDTPDGLAQAEALLRDLDRRSLAPDTVARSVTQASLPPPAAAHPDPTPSRR